MAEFIEPDNRQQLFTEALLAGDAYAARQQVLAASESALDSSSIENLAITTTLGIDVFMDLLKDSLESSLVSNSTSAKDLNKMMRVGEFVLTAQFDNLLGMYTDPENAQQSNLLQEVLYRILTDLSYFRDQTQTRFFDEPALVIAEDNQEYLDPVENAKLGNYMVVCEGYGNLIRSVVEVAKCQESKQLEELSQLTETDRKAGAMSYFEHEIRTPLTSMIGFLSTLREQDVNFNFAFVEEFFGIASSELPRIAKYIDLLPYFNMIYGPIITTDLRIADIRHELSKRMQYLEKKFTVCELIVEEGLEDSTVEGNMRAMLMLIQQYFNNVQRHAGSMDYLGLAIHREGDDIVFDVSDAGNGIDESEKEELFKEGVTTAAESGGTGKGLYYVTLLAEKMGMSVTASNRKDAQGATFSLKAKIKQPDMISLV